MRVIYTRYIVYARLCVRTQTRGGINATYCATRDPRINRGPCSRVAVKMSRSNDRHGDLARGGDMWYFTRSAALHGLLNMIIRLAEKRL